jgi:hypothetical protein
MTYQLVPPHCHRRNSAERVIRTFKEQFMAGLASVDPDFPMHLWDRILYQAEIILFNLLRASRLHPQLSSAAHFHGHIGYNKTAFAPPGCRIIAHEKPSQGRAWAPHGQPGYSLGPEMHHYRCIPAGKLYLSVFCASGATNSILFVGKCRKSRNRCSTR